MSNKEIESKAGLAVVLSKIKGFETPDVKKEQYITDSEVAATILWFSYMKGDIKGKIIADLGSGTGILGIGALLLGAKKVFFVEIDAEAMEIAKNNYNALKSEYSLAGEAVFLGMDVADFREKTDTVVENPPFGVKNEHSDKAFLKKAMATADVVYSLHKSESKGFIEAFSKGNGFRIGETVELAFPLKASLDYHIKKIHRFKVALFRLNKDLPTRN